MKKSDRELLMTLYDLCEAEIDLHYSPPNADEISSMVADLNRPIFKMRRILAGALRTSRIKPHTTRKIYAAAMMMTYGASWSEIDEVFGDAFAKDLRTRYREQFRIEMLNGKIAKQRGKVSFQNDEFWEPRILERLRQIIADSN